MFDSWTHMIRGLVGDSLKRERAQTSDITLDKHAHTVKGFFKEYPFVVKVEYPTTSFGAIPQDDIISSIEQWCHHNCEDEFRQRIHRVSKQTGISNDGSEEVEWFFNELGGRDYLFFAFKQEKDAVLFKLRW